MRNLIIFVVFAGVVFLIYKVVTNGKLIAKADGYAGAVLPTDWKTKTAA